MTEIDMSKRAAAGFCPHGALVAAEALELAESPESAMRSLERLKNVREAKLVLKETVRNRLRHCIYCQKAGLYAD